ncbi:N-acyl-L-homoserine lactone synthetase [Paracoccus suum]|uniref:acyl-homoserine-lactone synthase n=1 Tax=Paracoccus suum TaxID=2259340 RepID=A0A344PJ34_9RHOB|nr:acyl-homoserine-lactone synthase [Paracoccus suum]AXC49389.1 N-acyl-L-homoserine lactone synthetase [Paracoccus suum]
MQTTTLSFSNLHQHGELFANLLRARKQSFIVQNNWDLPEDEGMEFDQYDTPQSRWVAIHERGQVMAGVRLTPTTARCGIYSYMIRDAQLGILGGTIPTDLLYDEAPVASHVWESSRVFVSHAVPTETRRKVQLALIGEMTRAARDLGATRLIGIITTQWPIWAKRLHLDIQGIGRPLDFEDGQSQAVSISLATKLH